VAVLGKIRKFAQFLKLDYNMDTIQIKDKRFKTFIPEADILKEVARVANEINHDLEGENPLFLSVLNGSFMFTADLMKHLTIP
jgi:hypoxanthine phosphoribosyltransferase